MEAKRGGDFDLGFGVAVPSETDPNGLRLIEHNGTVVMSSDDAKVVLESLRGKKRSLLKITAIEIVMYGDEREPVFTPKSYGQTVARFKTVEEAEAAVREQFGGISPETDEALENILRQAADLMRLAKPVDFAELEERLRTNLAAGKG